MEATTLGHSGLLYDERDVRIDSSTLQIGTDTWLIKMLGKVEKRQPNFAPPPKNFLIGGAIALLLAFLVGGFLGFIFFIAGVGANVWWFLTQRPYSIFIHTNTGALVAGNWKGSGTSEFVDEVVRNVEEAKKRIHVRHQLLSEKNPFARFGPEIESRLTRLQSASSFERGTFHEFASDTIDLIVDSDLSDDLRELGLSYVTELHAMGINGATPTDDPAKSKQATGPLDAQSVYEQAIALADSDDNEKRAHAFELFTHAIELDPDHVPTLTALGRMYQKHSHNKYEQGETDEAHKILALSKRLALHAFQIAPSNEEVRFRLYAVHIDEGERHRAANEWSKSFDSYREALIADPQSFEAMVRLELAGGKANREKDMKDVFTGLAAKAPPYDANIALLPQASAFLENARELGKNNRWSDAFDLCVKSLDTQASVEAWLLLWVAGNESGRIEELSGIRERLIEAAQKSRT